MTLIVDLYWSFRSPYSYLVTPRLVALERDHDVSVAVKPVYPIAVRQPDFFANSDPLWFSYFMRDIHRSAEFLGMPFRWANPDPVVMDPATRTYPAEQPYIHRLTHLGVAASERGRGLVGLAGCRQGLNAQRSAEGVGRAVTASVVQAIVWIVVAASVTTIVFQRLGW